MVVEHHVKGWEQFKELVESLEPAGQPIHVLFSGGKDEKGVSWCPYCVTGKYINEQNLTFKHNLMRIC